VDGWIDRLADETRVSSTRRGEARSITRETDEGKRRRTHLYNRIARARVLNAVDIATRCVACINARVSL